MTLDDGRIAATVLEKNDLLALFEGFAHAGQQQGGKNSVHHLAALQVGSVDNLNLGQLQSL